MNLVLFPGIALIRISRPFLLAVGFAAVAISLSACAHMPWAVHDAGVAGPARIAGQVTSDRGAVLVDATVTLTGPSVRRTTRSDIAGHFSFERVPIGRYVVSAEATGFKSAKQNVTVQKEGTVRADLKLKM